MIGSGRLTPKQHKNIHKHLIPPLQNTFDIVPSRDRQQFRQDEMHNLSNVQQKSYFESQPQNPDQEYIQDVLGKLKEVEYIDQTPFKSRNKSQRLEDQEIIVIEEGQEIQSNLGNDQSEILEHIQFGNNDTRGLEHTPEWEEEQKVSKNKDAQVKYVINYIGEESPPWVTKDHQNISNSTPFDLDSQSFKLSRNRNSKNTCIDRVQKLQSQRNIQVANKSCIQKPVNLDESRQHIKINYAHIKQQKNKNVDLIIDKWAQNYPILQNQYLLGDKNLLRRGSADFQMERDAKFCLSKYKDQNSNYQNSGNEQQLPDSQKLPQSILDRAQTVQVQTEIAGDQLLHNENYLNQEIVQLKNRNMKLNDQVIKLREQVSIDQNQMSRLKQSLKIRENQIDTMKESFRKTHDSSEQDRKWGEQSRKMAMKNRELERLVSMQNEAIKQYQERNKNLQQKLHKTVSFQTVFSSGGERSPTFYSPQFQSIKLSKQQTFGLQQSPTSNSHQKCKQLIDELQEQKFDLEQKCAGIDIQVEKRVKAVSQNLEKQMNAKSLHQNKIITSLKEQLTKYKEGYKLFQIRLMETQQRYKIRQKQLLQRENQVKRIYEQLQKEWKQIQRQKQLQKKIKAQSIHPIQTIQSPKSNQKTKYEFDRQALDNPYDGQGIDFSRNTAHNYYFSTKQLRNPNITKDRLSYTKPTVYEPPQKSFLQQQINLFRKGLGKSYEPDTANLSYTRSLRDQNRWQKKQSPKIQYRDNQQLSAINNKIQRLRKQINKELDSIH